METLILIIVAAGFVIFGLSVLIKEERYWRKVSKKSRKKGDDDIRLYN